MERPAPAHLRWGGFFLGETKTARRRRAVWRDEGVMSALRRRMALFLTNRRYPAQDRRGPSGRTRKISGFERQPERQETLRAGCAFPCKQPLPLHGGIDREQDAPVVQLPQRRVQGIAALDDDARMEGNDAHIEQTPRTAVKAPEPDVRAAGERQQDFCAEPFMVDIAAGRCKPFRRSLLRPKEKSSIWNTVAENRSASCAANVDLPAQQLPSMARIQRGAAFSSSYSCDSSMTCGLCSCPPPAAEMQNQSDDQADKRGTEPAEPLPEQREI